MLNEHAGDGMPVPTRPVMPGTEQRTMHSRGTNREYRIYTALPAVQPPADGFPVIYLLDGNSVFYTMAEAVRLQSRYPERTGVDPSVVVGIGYSTDAPFDPARHYDYTLPVPRDELPPPVQGSAWPEQGGADAFLSFIENELKPEIERSHPINSSRQTLFGHSLGGLFVLHALFSRPDAFQTYVAGSPSIYWNERALLAEERPFIERCASAERPLRLLLAAGELEQTHPSLVNHKAAELSKRLAHAGINAVYKQFENENHISVLPVLISHAIRFAAGQR